jgi:hypothetical protein
MRSIPAHQQSVLGQKQRQHISRAMGHNLLPHREVAMKLDGLAACAFAVLAAVAAVAPSPAAAEEGQGRPAAPRPSSANFTALRDAILPSAEEERWRDIPWRASLLAAAGEAHADGKPLLLWAMNGHPLACT